MAAKITATPHGTGEGTPKIQNPTAARNPWARGTTTIACRTPFTVLPRWSKIWASWVSEKGETCRSSARSRPPSRRRKNSMKQEEGEVEGGGGEAGHEPAGRERSRHPRAETVRATRGASSWSSTRSTTAAGPGHALGQGLLQDPLERLGLEVRR